MSDFEQRKGATDFALALAAGRTVRDAAKAAGISESTAYRRMRDPAFCRRVAEVRRELIGRAAGRLADLAATATNTLGELLEAEGENVRLGAARAILDQAGRFNGHAESVEEAVRPAAEPDGLCGFRFRWADLSDDEVLCVSNIMMRYNGKPGIKPGEHLDEDECTEPTGLEDDAVEFSK